MRRVLVLAMVSLMVPLAGVAAPQDDVTAATRAWAEAYNSRDPQKLQALYAVSTERPCRAGRLQGARLG